MVRLLRPEPPSDLTNQQLHTDAGLGNSPLRRSLRVRRLLHRKQGPARRFRRCSEPHHRQGSDHLHIRPIRELGRRTGQPVWLTSLHPSCNQHHQLRTYEHSGSIFRLGRLNTIPTYFPFFSTSALGNNPRVWTLLVSRRVQTLTEGQKTQDNFRQDPSLPHSVGLRRHLVCQERFEMQLQLVSEMEMTVHRNSASVSTISVVTLQPNLPPSPWG